MAAPTYNDILTFNELLKKVDGQAGAAFKRSLEEVDFSDWTRAAEQLRQIVERIVMEYGLISAEIGAQWYEYCRSLGIGSGYNATLSEVDASRLRSSVNSEIDRLFAGEIGTGKLASNLASLVSDSVYYASRDTVLANLESEYEAAVSSGNRKMAEQCGYARVTTGHACAFCIMLASRGFAYSSEKSATKTKSGDSYHPNCRCVAVPFAHAGNISGYEKVLSDHEAKYREADNLLRSRDYPDDLRDRIDAAKRNHEGRWTNLNETLVIMRYQNEGMA